jgi:hypothetical protein
MVVEVISHSPAPVVTSFDGKSSVCSYHDPTKHQIGITNAPGNTVFVLFFFVITLVRNVVKIECVHRESPRFVPELFRSYSISGFKHFSCAFPNYNAGASPAVNDGDSDRDKDMLGKCFGSGFVLRAATRANGRLLDGNKLWLAVSYPQSESTPMGTVLMDKKPAVRLESCAPSHKSESTIIMMSAVIEGAV